MKVHISSATSILLALLMMGVEAKRHQTTTTGTLTTGTTTTGTGTRTTTTTPTTATTQRTSTTTGTTTGTFETTTETAGAGELAEFSLGLAAVAFGLVAGVALL